MNKQIITIGYDIPGTTDLSVSIHEQTSMMDADILLVSPSAFRPLGGWIEFSNGGGGCYDLQSSKSFEKCMSHLEKEIADHLSAGKNIFIFLTEEKKYKLARSVSSPRKGLSNYDTFEYSNYNFLPASIGQRTTASGKRIQFSGNPIFANFNNQFKNNLKYELYVEQTKNAHAIFTGTDKSKILGAVYNVGNGHIITLPILPYDENKFKEINLNKLVETGFWSQEAKIFGKNFIQCLIGIDKKLFADSEKTPPPNWISKKEFSGSKENALKELVIKNNEEIEEIKLINENLQLELEEESRLKDLLFEQGKPLEDAVIKALNLLGYEAENYDDGKLEMDQVILSPEKHRYIGETEGKDNKDINITKFRQLVDALNEDFTRDEVTEKAFGILFGNAERLKEPMLRTLDFTEKCKSGANREKIALVKTIDLFEAAKYLNEKTDEDFKKECRNAIHNGLGQIVILPKPPKY